ncbi:hypothetical protein HRbin27_01410 [bacterium HR27]|nr:hypothetical protein HRbin27_01410 [bacterium HR27]
MLDTHRQPDQVVTDARRDPLLRRQLPVRRTSRMDDQRLGIAHVRQMRPERDRVDHLDPGFHTALDAEHDHCTVAALAQVLAREMVRRMLRQPRVGDPGNRWMLREPARDLQGVRAVPLHPYVQGFQPQEQQERIERAHARSDIAHHVRAELRHIGQTTEVLPVRDSVIARIRIDQPRELAVAPVEPPRIDDHPADRHTVPANPLRRRVDHDIGTPFDRPAQVRRREGVVYDERDPMLVGDPGYRLDVQDIEPWIADRLGIDALRPLGDRPPEVLRVRRLDEPHRDTEVRERIGEQRDRAAVQARTGYDLVPSPRDVEDRQRRRSLAARRGHSGYATLEVRDALLEDLDGRITDPRVDVPWFVEIEQLRRVVSIMEDERGRLVDRHSPRTGRRIRCLSGVDCQRLDRVFPEGITFCCQGTPSFGSQRSFVPGPRRNAHGVSSTNLTPGLPSTGSPAVAGFSRAVPPDQWMRFS